MSDKIVIIGGGQTAASFIAQYRKSDANSSIVLVSEENALPYQRPPLSKKYATGDMTAEQLMLRPQDWYHDNNIECRLGVCVSAIDVEVKTVTLDNGEALQWDKLLFASGSRARSLPAAIGGDLEGVHTLRSITDADALSGKLKKGKRVAIIGGGYIGLEAAAVCASMGLNVTLIEAAERILQRVACDQTSEWFRDLHASKGVLIHESVALKALKGRDGKLVSVELSSGESIDVDFALVGIGIIPNVELAEQAGLIIDGGIVVNGSCQTSHPDIYAAGDCAAFDYKGHITRLESVQNAIDQAECAADNMAGKARDYHPYPWFWSDQYDVKLQIAGLNRGYDRIVTRAGEREGSMSHFYFYGDDFLAVDAMNDPRTYMVCKKLLEAGKTITPDQVADKELQLKSLL
jgi:3-phenylpropionate/trans-cinnamate dioxygenase ferredoxin reductase subunit